MYKVSKTRGRTRTPRALEKQRPAAVPHYNKSRRDIRDRAGCDVASLTLAGDWTFRQTARIRSGTIAAAVHRCQRGQQIRGNCSPLSMSTTRVAPIRLVNVTRLRGAPLTSPTTTAPVVAAKRRRICQRPIDGVRRDEGDEAAFIGDVERVEARESRTRPARPRGPGSPRSSSRMSKPGGLARSRPARWPDRRASGRAGSGLRRRRRAAPAPARPAARSRSRCRFELQAFARGHDGDAVPADVAAKQTDVARLHARRRDRSIVPRSGRCRPY